MYHYTDSGLDYVYLANGYEAAETPYGAAVAIHDLEGLHAMIGTTIAERPAMSGDEFRFIRLELGQTQADMARLLGVGESAVRNWEKGRTRQVPEPAANLMRALYLENINAGSKLGEVLKRISQLNRQMHHHDLQLQETVEGWRLVA